MEIKDLIGLWPQVLHLADKRELKKADVVAALHSDEPIPPAARALIADILAGKYKYKTGPLQPSLAEQLGLVHWFAFLEEEGMSNPKLRGETARTLAIETIESGFGISKRKIEGILSKHSRLLRSLRRNYSCRQS